MNNLNFQLVYASAREGIAKIEVDDESKDMEPFLKQLLKMLKHQRLFR